MWSVWVAECFALLWANENPDSIPAACGNQHTTVQRFIAQIFHYHFSIVSLWDELSLLGHTKWPTRVDRTETTMIMHVLIWIFSMLEKGPSGQLRTVKGLISLRNRACWSGPSLSAYRITVYCRIYQCITKFFTKFSRLCCPTRMFSLFAEWPAGPFLRTRLCIFERSLHVYLASRDSRIN